MKNKMRLIAARLIFTALVLIIGSISVIAALAFFKAVFILELFTVIGAVTTIVIAFKVFVFFTEQLEKEEERYYLTLDFVI